MVYFSFLFEIPKNLQTTFRFFTTSNYYLEVVFLIFSKLFQSFFSVFSRFLRLLRFFFSLFATDPTKRPRPGGQGGWLHCWPRKIRKSLRKSHCLWQWVFNEKSFLRCAFFFHRFCFLSPYHTIFVVFFVWLFAGFCGQRLFLLLRSLRLLGVVLMGCFLLFCVLWALFQCLFVVCILSQAHAESGGG